VADILAADRAELTIEVVPRVRQLVVDGFLG